MGWNGRQSKARGARLFDSALAKCQAALYTAPRRHYARGRASEWPETRSAQPKKTAPWERLTEADETHTAFCGPPTAGGAADRIRGLGDAGAIHEHYRGTSG